MGGEDCGEGRIKEGTGEGLGEEEDTEEEVDNVGEDRGKSFNSA